MICGRLPGFRPRACHWSRRPGPLLGRRTQPGSAHHPHETPSPQSCWRFKIKATFKVPRPLTAPSTVRPACARWPGTLGSWLAGHCPWVWSGRVLATGTAWAGLRLIHHHHPCCYVSKLVLLFSYFGSKFPCRNKHKAAPRFRHCQSRTSKSAGRSLSLISGALGQRGFFDVFGGIALRQEPRERIHFRA